MPAQPGAPVIAPAAAPPAPSPGATVRDTPLAGAHPFLRMHNVALGVSVLLMILQLRGHAPGEVAALLAIPIVAVATFVADRRYLPLLLVLAVPSMGVIRVSPGPHVFTPFLFRDAETFVPLAGVEASAPLVMLAAGFARVIVELLRGGRVFRGVVPWWLLAIFLAAMLPVLAGGLQGQALGYNRWSQGPRAMLALAGFFWGVVVARKAGGTAVRRLGPQMAGLALVSALLITVRFLGDMLLFVSVGMVGGMMPYFLARRRFAEAGICAAAVLTAVLALSLTTAGQVVLALGCVALSAPRARGVGRWLLRLGVAAACALSALMIWVVVQLQGKTLVEVASRDDGVMAFAVFKLLGDRGPLWLAAIEQITGGPYLVVPAGRPLRPEGFDYGGLVYTWEFGAHNAILELLRNVGLIGGAVGLALMGFALLAVVRLMLETRDMALRGVAAGLLGVVILGITTGNYPVYDVGFFPWAIAGMLAAARLYAPPRGAAAPDAEALAGGAA